MKNLVLILTRRPVNNHRSRRYKLQLVSRHSSMLHAQLAARRKSARDYRLERRTVRTWNIITDINTPRTRGPLIADPLSIATRRYSSIDPVKLAANTNFQIGSVQLFQFSSRNEKTFHPFPNRSELLAPKQPLPLEHHFFYYLPTSFSLFLFWAAGRFQWVRSRAGLSRRIKTRPTAFLSTLLFLRAPSKQIAKPEKGPRSLCPLPP